jgi:hypothetical protein
MLASRRGKVRASFEFRPFAGIAVLRGDKLITHDFGTGTRGFAASEDMNVAVCVLPGTELSFADEIRCLPTGLIAWRDKSRAPSYEIRW